MAIKDPKDTLSEIVDLMRDLEDAINTLESDSTYGSIDEGSLRNIEMARRLSDKVSSALDSMTRHIKRKKKEEENRYKIDFDGSSSSRDDGW